MDNQIIEQLYQMYGREIFLYLFSLCKNREMAEDLKQETFVKAMLSLPKQHTNMRAWLYMVARNLCFNQMAKDKRYTDFEDYENQLGESEDILERYILREEQRVLYLALLQMPTPKKEILQLQYFSGLSLKEIAALLHLSYESVRVLKHRAKQDLKKILEENGYEIS